MSGEGNPLVAEPEARSWSAGTFLLDDLNNTKNDIASQNWVSTGLESIPTAIDATAMYSDPIGSLVAMGFGWLLDHIDPLKTWLDELAGNPQAVEALSKTYDNVAERLRSEKEYLERRVEADLDGLEANFLTAYRAQARHLCDALDGLSETASVTGIALGVLAGLVDAVHGLVRDAISQVVGEIASAATEEIFTLGLATPAVVEQVSTKVAALASRCSKFLHDLTDTVHALDKLIAKIEGLLKKLKELMEKMHMLPEEHAPKHAADGPRPARNPDAPPPKHAKPAVDPDASTLGQVVQHGHNVLVHTGAGVREMPKDEIPADVWSEGATAVANYIQNHGYAPEEGGE